MSSASKGGATGFVRAFVVVLCALLGVVTLLNLKLGARSEGSREIVVAASEWQNRTRGVTYAPPINHTRPFKILRLRDRLPEINAVAVGASTVMGMTETMFPPERRLYNFTSAGNSTASIIAEAEAIQRDPTGRINYLLVVLDWVVGPVYLAAPVGSIDLTREGALSAAAQPHEPFPKRLQDALSWPRVRNLARIVADVARSGSPWSAFRQAFLQSSSDDYRCPDGTPARDFDSINRGDCSGYRYDGSWSYYGQKRLRESEIAPRVQAALAPSSKYTQYLIAAKGEPYRPYLDALAATAHAMRGQGGTLEVMLPPVLPGLERAMLGSPVTGPYLAKTKATLGDWAREHGIVILDAGQAETFGCRGSEFTDEHHAAPECFAKVMSVFQRSSREGRLHPGLNGAN